jgi:protein-tyrosine phosphatase
LTQHGAVLFVCLGNICRSPLAEAAFRREAERAGITVRADSAGTGDWHVGKPPDPRARAEALRHGIDISAYRGRQIERADFLRFDRIVAMDGNNLAHLRAMTPPSATARLSLLLDHLPGHKGSRSPIPISAGRRALPKPGGR